MRYKLIAFDMDGTLIEEPSCWRTLNSYFGTEAEAIEYLSCYERREISYSEFMHHVISLWKPVPHISEINQILKKFTLKPNVPRVLKEIKKMGYQIAIISAGIDIRAEDVAKELEIDHVVANGLGIDKKGYLTGEGIPRVELLSKHIVLEELSKGLGIDIKECVAVGDSKYDVNFLSHAGLGVAIGKDPELITVADIVIDNFEQLLNYL